VAALPVTESELRFLRALRDSKVRFMLVGLSAAALQGAAVVTQDVDLWFEDLTDPRLAAALRKVGAGYVPPFGLNPPMFAGAGSELFDIVIRMDGLDSFAEELENSVDVKIGPLKLRALSLKRILASKRAANRPKDRLTLAVLEDSASVGRTRVGRLRSPTRPRRKK
jgi:hypothetical protein